MTIPAPNKDSSGDEGESSSVDADPLAANTLKKPVALLPPQSPAPRWTKLLDILSLDVIDRSRDVTREMRAAGGQAVGKVRDRASAWILRRERQGCLRDVGALVFSERNDLAEHLPDSVRSKIKLIELIDGELAALKSVPDAGKSSPNL